MHVRPQHQMHSLTGDRWCGVLAALTWKALQMRYSPLLIHSFHPECKALWGEIYGRITLRWETEGLRESGREGRDWDSTTSTDPSRRQGMCLL